MERETRESMEPMGRGPEGRKTYDTCPACGHDGMVFYETDRMPYPDGTTTYWGRLSCPGCGAEEEICTEELWQDDDEAAHAAI